MNYVPVRTLVGNQLYMFDSILAHSITRELQIQLNPCVRGMTPKRTALRRFREMGTLRRTFTRCTGQIICSAGKLVLSVNSNDSRERELRHASEVLNAAA